MAHTLSVTDEDSGVTASMRVEEIDGQSRITSLTFDAVDGFGITAEHLRIVRYFGLQLPADVPSPAALPPAAPVAAERPATKSPKRSAPPRQRAAPARAATPKRKARYEGGVPSDAALQSMFAQLDGSANRIASAVGVSSATVYTWLKKARGRGTIFSTDAPASAGANNGVAVPAS